jgi:hypothetical protein
MPQLILYSTSGCHLCEQAQRIVQNTLGAPAPEVDIADDEQLLARYGVRIPVLRRTDTDAEIGWPFGEPDVLALLE